jgi:hypothetical protein
LLICEIADDWQRFLDAPPDVQATLEPRVTRNTYDLPLEVRERIDGLVSQVSVPFDMTSRPFGTDGTSYLFERRAGFNRIVLEWWHTGPENWSEVAVCFRAVWDALEMLVDAPES